MTRPPLLLAALLIAPLVACGGDDSPLLGTWQAVFFCEFDGPRSRRLHIKIVKD